MQEKLFYSIKDISDFVGESPSTLRYWESEFHELKPQRTPGGRRQYTVTDLDTIRKIQFLLRTKGMHTETAKEQLRKNNKNISTRIQVLKELEELKRDIEALLKCLNKIR